MKTKSTEAITGGGLPSIDEKTLLQIDEEAKKRCKGNVALLEHHRALLEGELPNYALGGACYKFFVVARHLPQYAAAETSVVEAWRRFVKNTYNIPKENQANPYALNWAIILNSCRRAQNDEEIAELLKERAQSIEVFAANGEVSFFRSFGRLLTPLRHSSLKRFDYTHRMLSGWLSSYLWLMPEIIASGYLAERSGERLIEEKDSDKALCHFKKTKAQYGLKAHQPNLIDKIQPDGKLILTAEGERLFRSVMPSK